MNKSHLQWIVTVILYLFPQSSQIDQEYASPTGPDSELHDLGLALARDVNEKSELEDGLTETELTGETNSDELSDIDKVKLLNKKIEVTSSTGLNDLIIEKVETKVKEEGLIKSRNEIGKEPADQFLQINDSTIKPIDNNSVTVKVLEKRDLENNEKEIFRNISDEVKSRENIIGFNRDYYSSTKNETQSNIIDNYNQEIKSEEKDSRKFREIKDKEINCDEGLKAENSINDILPKSFNLCFDKTTSTKSQLKRKLSKLDLESIIPNVQHLQADRDEEDSSKDMQGMIGVVENIMESIGNDIREELGLPENSKSKNIINLNTPESDDDKVQKILAVIASGLRDSLKDQSSSKYCFPLPRELHSFLIWLMHGYEGGANSPPTKSEQRSKPFYLFHEKSHRRHNVFPSDNIEECPSIVDYSKPIKLDDLSLIKGNIDQIDQQDESPELNYKKKMIFAEKSLYEKPTNMGHMVISPADNIQIGRIPGEIEQNLFQDSRFPLRKTYEPTHLLRTRCLGDSSNRKTNKSQDNNMELRDRIEDVVLSDEGGNTSHVSEPENYRKLRNISDSTGVETASSTQSEKEIRVIKRDLYTNSSDIINKTLNTYFGRNDARENNDADVFSPCSNGDEEDSSDEISSSLENSENDRESLSSGETIDFPVDETFKEKRRGKVSIFKDPLSNEVIVKLMPNSSNFKEMPYNEMPNVNPLLNSVVKFKNLTLNHHENESNIDESINKNEVGDLIYLYNNTQDKSDENMWKENEINAQTDTNLIDDKSMNSASKNKKQKKKKVNAPYQMLKITTLAPICEETFLNISDLLPQIYSITPASEKRNKNFKFSRRKESIDDVGSDNYAKNDPISGTEELNNDDYYDEKEHENAFIEYNSTVDKHKTICRDTSGIESDPTFDLPNFSSQSFSLDKNPENTNLKQKPKPNENSASEIPQIMVSNEKLSPESSPLKDQIQRVDSRLNVDLKPSIEIELFNKSLISEVNETLKTPSLNTKSKLIALELQTLNSERLNQEIKQKGNSQSYITTENPKSVVSNLLVDSESPIVRKNKTLTSKPQENLISLIPNDKYKSIEAKTESSFNPAGYFIVNEIPQREENYETTEGNLKTKNVESCHDYIESPVVQNLKAIISELKINSQSSIENEYPNIVILDVKENCQPIIGEALNEDESDFMQKAKLRPADENDKIIVSKVKRFLELNVPNVKPKAPMSKLIDHLKYFNAIEKPMIIHLEIRGKYNSTGKRKPKLELSEKKKNDLQLLDEKLQSVVQALKSYSDYSLLNKNPKVVILKVNSNPQSTKADNKNFKVIESKLVRHLQSSIADKIRGTVLFLVNDEPESILLLNEKLAREHANINKTRAYFANDETTLNASEMKETLNATEVSDKFKANALKIEGTIDSNNDEKIQSIQTNLNNESTDIDGKLNADLLELKKPPSAFLLEIQGTTEQSNKVDKMLGSAIYEFKGSTESFMPNEEIKVEDQGANETTESIEVNNELNLVTSDINEISESTAANNALKALVSEIISTTESTMFNDDIKPEVLVEVNETTESILIKDNQKAEMLEVTGTNESNNVERFKSVKSNLNGSTEKTLVNGKVEAFELELKGTTESNSKPETLKKIAQGVEVDGSSKIIQNNEKLKEFVSNTNENTAARLVNEKSKTFVPEVTGATESNEQTEDFKPGANILAVNGSSELAENSKKVKLVLPDIKENVASTVMNAQFKAFVPELIEITEPTVETENPKTMTDLLVLNSTSELTENNEKIKNVLSDFKEKTALTVGNAQFKAFLPETRETTELTTENADLRAVAEILKVNETAKLTENIEKVKTAVLDLIGTTKSSEVDEKFKVFVPEVIGTSESTEALDVFTGSPEKFNSIGLDLNGTTESNDKYLLKTEVASYLELKATTASSVVNEKPKAETFELNKYTDMIKPIGKVKTAMVIDLTQPTERTSNIGKSREVVLEVHGNPLKHIILDFKGSTESPIFNIKHNAVISEIGEPIKSDGQHQKHKLEFIQLKETIKTIKEKKEFERILSAVKETTDSTLVREKIKSVATEFNQNLGAFDQYKKHKTIFIELNGTAKPTKANEKLDTVLIALKKPTESTLANDKTKTVFSKLNKSPDSIELNKKQKAVVIELNGSTPSKVNVSLNFPLSTVGVTPEAPLANGKLKFKVFELRKRPESFALNKHPKTAALELKGVKKPTMVDEIIHAMASVLRGTTEATSVNVKKKPVIPELNRDSQSFVLNETLKTVLNQMIGASRDANVNEMFNAAVSVLRAPNESTSVNNNLTGAPSKINMKPESIEVNGKLKSPFTKLKGTTESSLVNEFISPCTELKGTTDSSLLHDMLKSLFIEIKGTTESSLINDKVKSQFGELKGTTESSLLNDKLKSLLTELKEATQSRLLNDKLKSLLTELKETTESSLINHTLKSQFGELKGTTESSLLNDTLKSLLTELKGTTDSNLLYDKLKSLLTELKGTPDSSILNDKLKSLFTELKGTTESSLLNDILKSGVNKSSERTNPTINALGYKQNFKNFKEFMIPNEPMLESKKPLTLILSKLKGTSDAAMAQTKSNKVILEPIDNLKLSSAVEKNLIKFAPNLKNKLEASILNKNAKSVISDVQRKSSIPFVECNLPSLHKNNNLSFSMVKKNNKIITSLPKENIISNAVLQNGDLKSFNQFMNAKTMPLVYYQAIKPVNDKSKAMPSARRKIVKNSLANKSCKSDTSKTVSTLINSSRNRIESKFKKKSKSNDKSKVTGTILTENLDEKRKTNLSEPSKIAKLNKLAETLVSQRMGKPGIILSVSHGKAVSNILGNKSITTSSKETVKIKDIEKIKLNSTVSNLKVNSKINISNDDLKIGNGTPESSGIIPNKNTKTIPQISLQNLNHKSNILDAKSQMTESKQNENSEPTTINKNQPSENLHSDIHHENFQNLISNQKENISCITKNIPLKLISKPVLPNLVSKSLLLEDDTNLDTSKSNSIQLEPNSNSNLNKVESEKHKRSINEMSIRERKFNTKDEEFHDSIDKKIVNKVIDQLLNEYDSNASDIQSKAVNSNTIDWSDIIKLSEQMKNSNSFDMENILKCLSEIINEVINKTDSSKNDSNPPNECKDKEDKKDLKNHE